ncbi:hypothetical protein D3C87_1026180 [compost metagenome]
MSISESYNVRFRSICNDTLYHYISPRIKTRTMISDAIVNNEICASIFKICVVMEIMTSIITSAIVLTWPQIIISSLLLFSVKTYMELSIIPRITLVFIYVPTYMNITVIFIELIWLFIDTNLMFFEVTWISRIIFLYSLTMKL